MPDSRSLACMKPCTEKRRQTPRSWVSALPNCMRLAARRSDLHRRDAWGRHCAWPAFRVAVYGNADTPGAPQRFAVLVAMDRAGRVPAGNVGGRRRWWSTRLGRSGCAPTTLDCLNSCCSTSDSPDWLSLISPIWRGWKPWSCSFGGQAICSPSKNRFGTHGRLLVGSDRGAAGVGGGDITCWSSHRSRPWPTCPRGAC